jgi:predicted Rossmann fold nucleotide-binding protein DprA/Smf involved in DNA uptake
MTEFRVIVAGSRTFADYELLSRKLDHLLAGKLADGVKVVVVSGQAAGADALGERWALARGLTVERHPARWDAEGRGAGFRRNERMAAVSQALVAFWNGLSQGTAHMIDTAAERGLAVRVVRF